MKISSKNYTDLVSLAKSANGRKETLDLLNEASKLKNIKMI